MLDLAMVVLLMFACAGKQGSAPQATLQESITVAARRGDVPALMSLGHAVARSSKITQEIYNVALYHSRPALFKERFIDSFPVDTQGVMGSMTVVTRVLGINRWYPYDALVRLASSGNYSAVKKLMLVLTVADGAPAELLGDGLGDTTKHYPTLALRSLATLPRTVRDKLLTDSYPWCSAGESAVKRMIPTGKNERVLKHMLEERSRTCR